MASITQDVWSALEDIPRLGQSGQEKQELSWMPEHITENTLTQSQPFLV